MIFENEYVGISCISEVSVSVIVVQICQALASSTQLAFQAFMVSYVLIFIFHISSAVNLSP